MEHYHNSANASQQLVSPLALHCMLESMSIGLCFLYAKNMRYGAENVRHGAKNLRLGAKNVRHGAENVWPGAKKIAAIPQSPSRFQIHA